MLGFKFILPMNYPQEAPICYLDEPENAEVVDMVDYLDKGNRIMFEYVILWGKVGHSIKNQLDKYNLSQLLTNVYKLFVQMPPVSFDELFGNDAQPSGEGEWQDMGSLLNSDAGEFRRNNTVKKGIFFDENEENLDDELKDFDPLAEL